MLVSEKPAKPTHANQCEQVLEKKLIESLQSSSESQSNPHTLEIQVSHTAAQHPLGDSECKCKIRASTSTAVGCSMLLAEAQTCSSTQHTIYK